MQLKGPSFVLGVLLLLSGALANAGKLSKEELEARQTKLKTISNQLVENASALDHQRALFEIKLVLHSIDDPTDQIDLISWRDTLFKTVTSWKSEKQKVQVHNLLFFSDDSSEIFAQSDFVDKAVTDLLGWMNTKLSRDILLRIMKLNEQNFPLLNRILHGALEWSWPLSKAQVMSAYYEFYPFTHAEFQKIKTNMGRWVQLPSRIFSDEERKLENDICNEVVLYGEHSTRANNLRKSLAELRNRNDRLEEQNAETIQAKTIAFEDLLSSEWMTKSFEEEIYDQVQTWGNQDATLTVLHALLTHSKHKPQWNKRIIEEFSETVWLGRNERYILLQHLLQYPHFELIDLREIFEKTYENFSAPLTLGLSASYIEESAAGLVETYTMVVSQPAADRNLIQAVYNEVARLTNSETFLHRRMTRRLHNLFQKALHVIDLRLHPRIRLP
jgi:hypothetical protein